MSVGFGPVFWPRRGRPRSPNRKVWNVIKEIPDKGNIETRNLEWPREARRNS